MNISFPQRASNKNSLKFSTLRGSSDSYRNLEFVWELLTFFVTFLGQAKKVKKFKTLTMYSFANNIIYSKRKNLKNRLGNKK